MDNSIKYLTTIVATAGLEDEKIPYKLPIRGIALHVGPNKNRWGVDPAFLRKIAEQLPGKTLRINHGTLVTDVIGKITNAAPNEDKVIFEAEIIGSDQLTTAIKEKIINGLLDSVSIQIEPTEIVCSVCGKQTRKNDIIVHNVRTHGEDAYEIVKDGEVKELSIVLDPAYDKTKLNIAASFNEAMDKYITVPPTTGETSPITAMGDIDVTASGENLRAVEQNGDTRGENMSAPEVPKVPAEQGQHPSFEQILSILKDISYKSEEIAKKMADFDARLKSLEEAEEARRQAAEAGRKAEEAEEANEAKEYEKDDANKMADTVADIEAALAKSQTLLGDKAGQGVPTWAQELAKAMKLFG